MPRQGDGTNGAASPRLPPRGCGGSAGLLFGVPTPPWHGRRNRGPHQLAGGGEGTEPVSGGRLPRRPQSIRRSPTPSRHLSIAPFWSVRATAGIHLCISQRTHYARKGRRSVEQPSATRSRRTPRKCREPASFCTGHLVAPSGGKGR
ncbi:unnamed protein product, partial [Ixodes hexagonus]